MGQFDEILNSLVAEGGGSSSFITNIPSAQAEASIEGKNVTFLQPAPPPTQAPQEPQARDPYADALATMRSTVDKINAATTAEDKSRLLYDLRSSAIPVIETAQKAVTTQLEREFGLDRIRKQADYFTQQAMYNPAFAQQANVLQQRLQQSETRVQSMVAQRLNANPRLQAFIKTVDGELAIQADGIKKMEASSIKKLAAEETAQEEAKILLAGADQNVLSHIKSLDNNLQSDVEVARFLKGAKGKEWAPFVQGLVPPEKYLEAALSGSTVGQTLAVKEQMKRTGASEREVINDMRLMANLVSSPAALAEEFKKKGIPLSPEITKAIQTQSLNPSNAGKQQLQQFALQNIDKLMLKQTQGRLESDISSWSADTGLMGDPVAKQTFDALKAKNLDKPVDVRSFAKAYLNGPDVDKEERARREKILFSAYDRTFATKGSGGLFHQPIPRGVIEDGKRAISAVSAMDSIAARAGRFLGENLSGAASITPIAGLYQAHEKILQTEYQTLDAFFQGLVSGGKK